MLGLGAKTVDTMAEMVKHQSLRMSFPREDEPVSLQEFLDALVENPLLSSSSVCVVLAAGNYTLDDTVVVGGSLDLTLEGAFCTAESSGGTTITASGLYAFRVKGERSRLTLRNLNATHTRYRKKEEDAGDTGGLSAFSLAALREFALERGVSMAQLDRNPEADSDNEDATTLDVVDAVQRHYDAGACVFVENNCVVNIEFCTLFSQHGYSLWVVHEASVMVHDCTLSSTKKSAAVVFGDSYLQMDRTVVSEAGQHGVCLRGRARLCMNDCTLRKCTSRALYGYQHVDIILRRCIVTQTRNRAGDATGAVEVRCDAGAPNKLKLELVECKIFDNAGVGLRVSGRVALDVDEDSRRDNADGELLDLSDEWAGSGGEGGSGSGSGSGSEEGGDPINIHWEYHADDSKSTGKNSIQPLPTWHRYNSDDSKAIEVAFGFWRPRNKKVKGALQLILLCCGKYSINVQTLEQTNVATLHSRAIRRIKS